MTDFGSPAMFCAPLVSRLFRNGTLTVTDAAGHVHTFGGAPGPTCHVRLADRSLYWKLLINPELYLGEAYMDGTLVLERGSLHDLFELLAANLEGYEDSLLRRLVWYGALPLRRLWRVNPIARARRNAAHHYDLSGSLFDLFLDRDHLYSCAYFLSDDDSLEDAQANKLRHIAAKLLLDRPDLRVLDFGSGWGSMALYLAAETGCRVTGLTLSQEQLAASRERAREVGLDGRVDFELQDYRQATGVYDRIVSVGMFEHVGARNFDQFFERVGALLADDGVMVLHSIGTIYPPRIGNAWIEKYIFPGGYIPSLSEVFAAVERHRLHVTDVEVLRDHYARTLDEWLHRFQAGRDRAKTLYDERFCRMWEFYLASCAFTFRHWGHMVFQMQIAKRVDAVPITRDYMADRERALRDTEAAESRRKPRRAIGRG